MLLYPPVGFESHPTTKSLKLRDAAYVCFLQYRFPCSHTDEICILNILAFLTRHGQQFQGVPLLKKGTVLKKENNIFDHTVPAV